MLHNRRDILRLAGAAGLASLMAPWLARRARAATDAWAGPYWLFVQADGGWDPTMLCDPKGRVSETDPEPVNHYFADEIEQVGPFRVAPIDGNLAFFQRFRDRLLVINGIDTQTNSHEVGTRFTFSGRMDPGAPALGALIAAFPEDRPSMSWLAQSGYDITAGLLAQTRLDDTRTVLEIAYPDRLDPSDPDSALFTPGVLQRLQQARADRLQRLIDQPHLPRTRRSLELLAEARGGDNELAALADVLPDDLDDSSDLRRQAQLAMACFKAGVSISSCIRTGGFDTHGNHDDEQSDAMQTLVDGLTFAMDEAERQGIADDVIVVVGSDFGRTPWYNDGMGKDHWSISSMLLMGPGIHGGRVVGGTDPGQSPLLVDPTSLAIADAGLRLTPAHVHAALRQLAGIDTWEVAARYSVGAPLPLLG